MRKIIAVLLALSLITAPVFAAWDKTKPANNEKFIDTPAQIRANWDAIELGTDSALQVTNAKVASNAAIVDTKLAQITTASKVSGAALTSLSSTPSGAGAIPAVNLPNSIADSHLAQLTTADKVANSALVAITTAGKVDGSAITNCANIPSGAGKIPVANIDTGTTANKIVILDGSAKLPAVDGSALTNLNIPEVVVSLFSTFGGDGSDGNITVSSDTNFSTIDSSNTGILQAGNFTVQSGKTLTVDTRFAYIAVSGTCTISGTISANGKGGLGGPAGTTAGSGESNLLIVSTLSGLGVGGSGGGYVVSDGYSGGAGGKGNLHAQGDATPTWKTSSARLAAISGVGLTFYLENGFGAGGARGYYQSETDAGQPGGGVIYIECNELVLTGAVSCDGLVGSSGGSSWGGCGGGGTLVIRAKTITTNSGTVTAAGGVNGYSNGQDGFALIVDVP